MCLVTGILVGHQVDGNSDCLDLFLQVIFYNLLPAASQLVQIQKTYGANSFFRVTSGPGTHPHGSGYQDNREEQASEYRNRCNIIFSVMVHQSFTASLRLYHPWRLTQQNSS